MNEPSSSKDAIENRKAMYDLVREEAARGDPICGGLLALESEIDRMDGAYAFITDDVDEDDDIRPY